MKSKKAPKVKAASNEETRPSSDGKQKIGRVAPKKRVSESKKQFGFIFRQGRNGWRGGFLLYTCRFLSTISQKIVFAVAKNLVFNPRKCSKNVLIFFS